MKKAYETSELRSQWKKGFLMQWVMLKSVSIKLAVEAERAITFDRVWIRLRFCARWKDIREWNIFGRKKIQKHSKMKMKNEEEENQLLVELCYNYHFHRSKSSIIERSHCEKIFQKN